MSCNQSWYLQIQQESECRHDNSYYIRKRKKDNAINDAKHILSNQAWAKIVPEYYP